MPENKNQVSQEQQCRMSYERSPELVEGILLVPELEREVEALSGRTLGQDERQDVLVRDDVSAGEVNNAI